MKTSRKIWPWIFIIIIASFTGILHLYRSIRPTASDTAVGHFELEHDYFTVVDETGEIIFTTGHTVAIGDEYIDEDDTRYIVISVVGNTATVRSEGRMEGLPELALQQILEVAASNGAVGIYHTHSSESYIPSDHTDSIPGKGGIVQVGSALANKLNNSGITAIHDTTSHDPNDARAYDRSRRTAVDLLKKQTPLALFDVHRDAGPAESYLQEVNGEEVTKCMIVIGRQNPKMESNLEFARRLKDEVNSQFTGLVKGIFMGNADFNQDLFDKALLLEIGTEETSKEAAMRGASLIGSVLTNILPVSGPGSAPQGRAAGRTIGWLIGAVVVGTFVYLWVATGSWEEMKAKLLAWFSGVGIKVGGTDADNVGEESGTDMSGSGKKVD